MDGVWSEDKWQKRGDTTKSCSLLHVNANTRLVFLSELFQYTITGKKSSMLRERHMSLLSQRLPMVVSACIFQNVLFFHSITLPQGSVCSLRCCQKQFQLQILEVLFLMQTGTKISKHKGELSVKPLQNVTVIQYWLETATQEFTVCYVSFPSPWL